MRLCEISVFMSKIAVSYNSVSPLTELQENQAAAQENKGDTRQKKQTKKRENINWEKNQKVG